jgi:hypothetical protein
MKLHGLKPVPTKFNPVIIGFYSRLLARSSHKMVAIIAAMRKFFTIVIVVFNKVAFDPERSVKMTNGYI